MKQDFEQEFKQLKQDEIPDLWNRIEAGLSEKQPATALTADANVTARQETSVRQSTVKRVTWRKWATLAATIVCLIIILPVLSLTVAKDSSKSESYATVDGYATEETSAEETAESEVLEELEEATVMDSPTESAVGEAEAAASAEKEMCIEDSVESALADEIEADVEERQASLPTKQELFSKPFVYNTFLEQYKADLEYIRVFAYFSESELIEREDSFELTNATVTKHYYLDAEVVDNAKVGDTILIQGIEYSIQTMEPNAYGYSVALQYDDSILLQENQDVYPDIYAFERTKDGKHYVILYCSGDYISEEIYSGSVFFDKECILNGYYQGEVCDVLLSEYYELEEYPYISIMSFKITKEGLIRSFQNQIAG